MPPIQKIAKERPSLAQGYGKRLAIHALSLLAALAVSSSLPPEFMTTARRAALFLCTYAGLIALLPHTIKRRGLDIIPVLAGLGPAVAFIFSGAPWQLVFLWAGIAALLSRLLFFRNRMKSALLLLPVLSLALISFGLDLQPLSPISFPLCCAVTALAAWLGSRALRSMSRLEAIQDNPILQDKGKRRRIMDYYKQLHDLEAKITETPMELHRHITSMSDDGKAMLTFMVHTPAVFPSGERFLTRYLPKALELIDTHMDLLADQQAEGAADQEADAQAKPDSQVARSAELIARLAQAFQDQLKTLRDDKNINIDADLAVLDKLLKMDGQG